VNDTGLDDDEVVEVLGVFSIIPLEEPKKQYIKNYDIKLLDGRYYIIHTHLRDSYKELRRALLNFLQKSATIDDNIYKGIKIDDETLDNEDL